MLYWEGQRHRMGREHALQRTAETQEGGGVAYFTEKGTEGKGGSILHREGQRHRSGGKEHASQRRAETQEGACSTEKGRDKKGG